MITSRGFEECLLAALVCGGLVAVLASPVAGLVLGVMLAVAATTLTPCGCFVNWDAKRAMRAHDPAHARRLPVSIVTRHRQSPVPQPGRRGSPGGRASAQRSRDQGDNGADHADSVHAS